MSEAELPSASAHGVTLAVPGSVDAAGTAPSPSSSALPAAGDPESAGADADASSAPGARPRGRRSKGRLAPVLGTARLHLRQALEDEGYLPRNMARGQQARNPAGDGPLRVLVALSGGPDSLALAATTAFYARGGMFEAGAVVVDHQLQEGSAEVAQRAADQARELGLDPVRVVAVTVKQLVQGWGQQLTEPPAAPPHQAGPRTRTRPAKGTTPR